jgi:NTE family protein
MRGYRHGLIGMALLAMAASAAAQQAPQPAQSPAAGAAQTVQMPASVAAVTGRPRIGLVLGGGGAKGFAHIGVLKELERLHVPVDVVTGTSMGAVVGSMYAVGNDADGVDSIAHRIDWNAIFSDKLSRDELSFRRKVEQGTILLDYKLSFDNGKPVFPKGVLGYQRLYTTLQGVLAKDRTVAKFDDFATPFRAIATDIGTGDAVTLGGGDIASAVFASMAIPAAFPPVQRDGRLLVDGGVANNVPINPARALGVDALIVVDIGEPPMRSENITSALDVLNQMQLLLGYAVVRDQIASLKPTDVLIKPDITGLSVTGFDKVDLGIERGRDAARKLEAQLRRYSLSDADWAAYKRDRAARAATVNAPRVDYIKIVNTSKTANDRILAAMTTKAPTVLDGEKITRDVNAIYDIGGFDSVTYNLVRDGARQGLEIDARRSPYDTRYFQFGMLLSTDFGAATDFSLAVAYVDRDFLGSGWEWRGGARVGSDNFFDVDLYKQWNRVFFRPYAYWHRLSTQVVQTGNSAVNGTLAVITAGAGAQTGLVFGNTASIYVGAEIGGVNPLSGSVPTGVPNGWNRDVSWEVGAIYDTADSLTFPTKGSFAQLEFSDHLTALGGNFTREELRANLQHAITFGRTSVVLGGKFGGTWNAIDNFVGTQQLGGFLRLSGLPQDSLIGQQSLLGRLVVYNRVSDKSPIMDLPLYLGGSIEAGNVFRSPSDVDLGRLRTSFSGFVAADTLIGPLFLGYGHSSGGNNAIYLIIGRVF